MRIVKAEEMAAIDHDTIHKVGIPGSALMERAGHAVFASILKHFGSVKGKRFLVVALEIMGEMVSLLPGIFVKLRLKLFAFL